jgi:hypothetical protein
MATGARGPLAITMLPTALRPFFLPFHALSPFLFPLFSFIASIWLLLTFPSFLCLGGRPLDRLMARCLLCLVQSSSCCCQPEGHPLRQRPSTGPFIPLDGGRPMARRVFRRAPSFSNEGPPSRLGSFPPPPLFHFWSNTRNPHTKGCPSNPNGDRRKVHSFHISPFPQFLSIYGQFFQSPGKKFANFFGKKNSRNWLKFVGLFLSKNMPKNTISIGQFMDLSITKWLKRIPSYSLSIN